MAFKRETYVPGVEGRVLVVTHLERGNVFSLVYSVDEEEKPIEALCEPIPDLTLRKGKRRHAELCSKYNKYGLSYEFSQELREYVPNLEGLVKHIGISRLSRE